MKIEKVIRRLSVGVSMDPLLRRTHGNQAAAVVVKIGAAVLARIRGHLRLPRIVGIRARRMMGGISRRRRRLRQRIVAAGNQAQRIVRNQVPQVPRTTARPGEIGSGRNRVTGNGTS